MLRLRPVLPALIALSAAPCALAQTFDNRWLEFVEDTAQPGVAGLSSTAIEVDFAYGDLDGDGWIDLAVARKQPVSTSGKRTNVLLMNESGVLTDRTATLASTSDVPGDSGFSTATNDSDIALVDVDGDGLLDAVTAPRLSQADPKHIGHPRVYRNLGFTGSTWNGFGHEDARIPQLFNLGGNPGNPNFTTVAGGDLDGDGSADLYFGDATGGAVANDYGDRLLSNDGTGFFTDVTMGALTLAQANIRFATKVDIADMNLDGTLDIVQDGGFNRGIFTQLNPPATPGTGFGQFAVDTSTAYNFALGDLNNDGRLDITIASNGNDGYRINQGTNPNGSVNWSAKQTYDFLQNNDDGFGGQSQVIDLDLDGFADSLVCDVDADLAGFNRRFHMYHNLGTTVGGTPQMLEERELNTGGGWLGAVGLLSPDLRGSFDVAAFDVDNDGDPDMVLGTASAGTKVWINQTATCQPDLGFGGPGSLELKICGLPLSAGNTTPLEISGGPAFAITYLALGQFNNPTPLFGGTVVPVPTSNLILLNLGADGSLSIPVDGSLAPPGTVRYVQAAAVDVTQVEFVQLSNAVEATWE